METPLRVVSWNMGHTRRSWDYLGELDPDLALLQEANAGAAPGWAFERWPGWVMRPVRSWGWGSAIIAKRSLNLEAIRDEAEGMELEGWIALGIVRMPDTTSMVVGSVHAPPFRPTPEHLGGRDPALMALPRYRAPRSFDVAYATVSHRIRGHRFLVGGDWNISPQLWLTYHPRSHDADFFVRAARDGWVDCYRRDHDSEGQTWFRANNLPYQFDHVFCDEVTAKSMGSCTIDPRPAATLRVSDHAPLVAEFEQ